MPRHLTCPVWGDRHKVVFDRHLGEGEACDLYRCQCGWERAWADVDADANREHPEYVIIDADEEAVLLGALPA